MSRKLSENRVAVFSKDGRRLRSRVYHFRQTRMMTYCGRLYDTTVARDDAATKLNLWPCMSCRATMWARDRRKELDARETD